MREASKRLFAGVPRDVLLVGLILFVGATSFIFGVLVGQDTPTSAPFSVCDSSATPVPTGDSGGEVVASKTGTKYFLPWCGGAKNISAENLLTFSSAEEAQAKGYEPAANCKGL